MTHIRQGLAVKTASVRGKMAGMSASKRLAVALFLVLVTYVQPSQPQPSQVQRT